MTDCFLEKEPCICMPTGMMNIKFKNTAVLVYIYLQHYVKGAPIILAW
jgi:hypothetical protein